MSISLSDLKKSQKSRLDTLITKSQDNGNGSESKKDERFWQPTADKVGNGSAVIRFLPASPQDGLDALPWAKFWEHGFKGPSGRWYIEKSLTSIGQKDPVSEYNNKLWETGDEELKEQVRKQKRRLNFVTNILVITDPASPENNGKVFLYKFGQKIFEKIKNIMTPDEDLGEEANDPFDFWSGQNFKLKIKKVGDFRNYDDSSFSAPTPLFKDDAQIEKVWQNQHSLKEFTDPVGYKSYDELRKSLYDVLQIRDESISTTAERLSMSVDSAMSNNAKEDALDMDGEDSDLDAILKGL